MGGVAIFVQSHMPVKLRSDFMLNDVGVLWVQVHLPHLKPIEVSCCYSPSDADVDYVIQLCEMIERVSDMSSDIYLLRDKNTDWNDGHCPKKKKNIYLCLLYIINCFLANNISH